MARAPIAVANAPVSYGAFELTVGQDPNVPDGTQVLDQVAAAGYAGIDLGPVGYLGDGDAARRAAGRARPRPGRRVRGTAVLRPGRARGCRGRARRHARRVRRGAVVPGRARRRGRRSPTRAVSGGRCSRPGPFGIILSVMTPTDGGGSRPGWLRWSPAAATAATSRPSTRRPGPTSRRRGRSSGCSTVSDVGLCLETGHMMLGGGDPVAMLRDSVTGSTTCTSRTPGASVMEGIVADGAPVTEIWTREAFCELGHGDLDVDAVLGRAAAASRSAAGWWWSRTSCRAARSGSRGPPRNSGTTAPSWPNEGCDMAPFRLGLVGAGRMGRTHLRALAGSERVAVTAIAEVSAAARAAPWRPPASTLLRRHRRRCWTRGAIDGVLIAAPSDQHGADHRRGRRARPADPVREAVRADRRADPRVGRDGARRRACRSRSPTGGGTCPALRRLRDRMAAGELGVIHLVTCYQWDEQPPSAAFRAHSGGIRDRHGRARVRPAALADRPGHQRPAAVASGLVPGGLGDPRTGIAGRGQRAGDRGAVRRRHRLHLAGPVLPGGRHGAGRGVRHAGHASGATSSTRPRASAPSSRRCGARPRASRSSRRGGPCQGATAADAVAALDAPPSR